MRDEYETIQSKGAEVVAIGTGDARYDKAFADDDQVPFLVLVDDDAEAANAAAVRSASAIGLLNPKSFGGAVKARRSGHKIHKSGKRVTQLGATFVVGPGDTVRYEHLDEHTADHAPLAEVLAALPG